MLKAQVEASRTEEMSPTAEDYTEALATLERLQKEAYSPMVEGTVRSLRNIALGFTSLSGNAIDLVGWSLISALPMTESFKKDVSRFGTKMPKEKLVQLVRELGEGKIVKDYENLKEVFATAREVLEKRQKEAEEIAKR